MEQPEVDQQVSILESLLASPGPQLVAFLATLTPLTLMALSKLPEFQRLRAFLMQPGTFKTIFQARQRVPSLTSVMEHDMIDALSDAERESINYWQLWVCAWRAQSFGNVHVRQNPQIEFRNGCQLEFQTRPNPRLNRLTPNVRPLFDITAVYVRIPGVYHGIYSVPRDVYVSREIALAVAKDATELTINHPDWQFRQQAAQMLISDPRQEQFNSTRLEGYELGRGLLDRTGPSFANSLHPSRTAAYMGLDKVEEAYRSWIAGIETALVPSDDDIFSLVNLYRKHFVALVYYRILRLQPDAFILFGEDSDIDNQDEYSAAVVQGIRGVRECI